MTALVQTLRAQPSTTPDGRRLTAGAALMATRFALGEPATWPALADALHNASVGNPTALADMLVPVTGPRGTYDAVVATDCNDVQNRVAPDQIGALATRWRAEYPLFGGSFAADLLACAPWPTGGANRRPPVPPDLPPIAVIGTAAGPRMPLDASRAAAQDLPSAVFLTWQGAGTGAFPRTQCITSLVDTMLVDGAVPETGLICPP